LIEFDKNKKYFLEFEHHSGTLVFTATEVEITGTLISFTDKFNKQLIFPIDSLRQAKEVL